jgi:hypothetical protein
MPRFTWPSWRWITTSGTPSWAISTACACRSWCGAKRRLTPARTAIVRSCRRTPWGDHGRPRVAPLITQNNAPTGSCLRTLSHGSSCCQPQASIPTSRRLPPLPLRTRTAPRDGSRSLSASASASLIRSPERHSTTIIARNRSPIAPGPAARITRTISSTVGGSAG